MIKLIWLKPRTLDIIWQKETWMLYIALWFFCIRLDLGRGFRKRILLQKLKDDDIIKVSSEKCKVCSKPLDIKDISQVIKYCSKSCRKLKNERNRKVNTHSSRLGNHRPEVD